MGNPFQGPRVGSHVLTQSKRLDWEGHPGGQQQGEEAQGTSLPREVAEFPSGLVVRILDFNCRKSGSLPGQGTQVPQAI